MLLGILVGVKYAIPGELFDSGVKIILLYRRTVDIVSCIRIKVN